MYTLTYNNEKAPCLLQARGFFVIDELLFVTGEARSADVAVFVAVIEVSRTGR